MYVNSQKVERRFQPPVEKLRGDVKLIWHPLLFRSVQAIDVPALVTSSCECGATSPSSQTTRKKKQNRTKSDDETRVQNPQSCS